MSLLASTKALLDLHNESKSLAEIHRQIGGSVNRNWLYKFAKKKIISPGVVPLQTLHDSLKKLRLKSR
jgi:hypothetical protein